MKFALIAFALTFSFYARATEYPVGVDFSDTLAESLYAELDHNPDVVRDPNFYESSVRVGKASCWINPAHGAEAYKAVTTCHIFE